MTPTVLVADNSPSISKVIATCFTNAGCRVVGTCYDGVSTLERARLLRPDILTFDLILPRLSGLQMVASLRRLDLSPTLIAISAVTSRARIAAAKTLGVCYYVLKAVNEERLTKLAADIIEDQQPLKSGHLRK